MKRPPGTLLLIEDEPDIARTVSTLLGMQGHRVEVASSVAEAREALRAIALARREGVDRRFLVVLDALLPDGHGLDVLRTVREQPLLSDLPVLMLTCLDSARITEQGFVAGANAYLPKPCDAQRLLAAVNLLLEEAYPA